MAIGTSRCGASKVWQTEIVQRKAWRGQLSLSKAAFAIDKDRDSVVLLQPPEFAVDLGLV